MAAPKFTPVEPTSVARGYESPEYVADPWMATRPADLDGRQPVGPGLGFQGPDQGYALKLAALERPNVRVQPDESVDDALAGATAIALRRASLFGRAPVMHDLRIALRIWGFLDPAPPAELVAARRPRFLGLADAAHHYTATRALVDAVPESTLRATHDQIAAARPDDWPQLTGAERF